MIQNQNKKKIIRDFEMMKSFEESTRNVYIKVHTDARVKDTEIQNTFKELAADEQRHAEIVQEIINIIENAL